MPLLPSSLLLISPLPYVIWCQVFLAVVFKEEGRSCLFSGGHLVMSGDIFDGPHWVGVVCSWHPADRFQGCCWTSDSAENTPHSKEFPSWVCQSRWGWEPRLVECTRGQWWSGRSSGKVSRTGGMNIKEGYRWGVWGEGAVLGEWWWDGGWLLPPS